jgi:hypothetical protein
MTGLYDLPVLEIMYLTHLRNSADIISSFGAASITCCHELVEPGITKPKLKNHSKNINSWFSLKLCDKLKQNYL